MFGDTLYNQDIFITIANKNPLWTGNYNQATNEFVWTPTLAEAGTQQLIVTIIDKYRHSTTRDFVIQTLISPCETDEKHPPQIIEKTDTLIIEKTDTLIIEKTINKNTKKEKKWRPKQFSPFSND